jgi:hypothetical protein
LLPYSAFLYWHTFSIHFYHFPFLYTTRFPNPNAPVSSSFSVTSYSLLPSNWYFKVSPIQFNSSTPTILTNF